MEKGNELKPLFDEMKELAEQVRRCTWMYHTGAHKLLAVQTIAVDVVVGLGML